jgi:hypothetical protein
MITEWNIQAHIQFAAHCCIRGAVGVQSRDITQSADLDQRRFRQEKT